MSKSLILLSGGLDSSTLACKLINEKNDVEGLFIDYGQVMVSSERRSAEFIAKYLEFPLKIIKMQLDDALKTGSLFEDNPQKWESKFVSFLPQRNLLLLTIAAMYAQKRDIRNIYIGIIKVLNNPFPDTTPKFMLLTQNILRESYPQLNIKFPFSELDKTAVVEEAIRMGLPLEATFSCEMSANHHCMECPSCLDRYWALKDNRR